MVFLDYGADLRAEPNKPARDRMPYQDKFLIAVLAVTVVTILTGVLLGVLTLALPTRATQIHRNVILGLTHLLTMEIGAIVTLLSTMR
jgi:hypothetical protein